MYNVQVDPDTLQTGENMNQKALKILEFDKIIDMLTGQATCESGKELCRQLEPVTDYDAINAAQQQTKDALERLYRKGSISFSGLRNPGMQLKRLEIGGVLNAEELLMICRLLDIAKKAKAYSREVREDAPADSLEELFSGLEPLTPLSEEISRCIVSVDEISDDASPTLHNIRRQIRNINDRIHGAMNSILNNSTTRTYLQDAVVTMRNDRYCLPVKVEYKAQVPGMIHDQSASGSTLFIEPMSVVKLNNDLKEAFLKEKEEIDVILSNLSNLTAEYATYIENDFHILTTLDFIFAKAKLAKSYNGMAPVFNTEGRIRIRQGRHPLLDKHKVVPIDVRLGEVFHLLIITGPNTGGKTVSLKTVGLFTLMGQAGLHIPAGDRSELAIFDEVYADIGDEQSIEQSLSTFSSHMTNIVSILDKADQNSLVLFDELCAGTDPTEGAALAISILSFLHNMKCRTMATTHYSELKVFALSTPGVENACCEFNVETLRPTYKLLIGIPGKSNAFAISKQLGLPDYIIDDAKTHLESNDEAFEDLLANLEQSRVTIEKEREEIASYKEEISRLKKNIEQKEERLDERKEKLLKNANEEAQRILREAKETADQTIRNINKLAASSGVGKELEAERTKLREKLDKVDKNLSLKNNKGPKKTISPKKLKIGDGVKVLTMNLKGTVSTLPNAKGDLYVQMGILRSLVNIKDLELLDEASVSGPGLDPAAMKRNNTGSGKIKMAKSFSVSPEVNLIGMTTDEAMPVLDKYLDDAYLAHLPQVRVVHGRGTGALRAAVHKHLKKLKYVKEFRLGEFGEGDTGVTIVTFK